VEATSQRVGKGFDILSEIRQQRLAVRGLVLDRGEVRGVIAGRASLDKSGLEPPRIHMDADSNVTAGDVAISPGDVLVVHGSGFRTSEGESTVVLRLDDEGEVIAVQPNRKGEFRHELRVRTFGGDHVLAATQRDTFEMRAARGAFKVITDDKEGGDQPQR
jgi:hypothetical protein